MNYYAQKVIDFVARLADYPGECKHPGDVNAQAVSLIEEFRKRYDEPSDTNGWRCPDCGTRLKYQGWPNKESWDAFQVLGAADQDWYRKTIRIVAAETNLNDAADALEEYWYDVLEQGLTGTNMLVRELVMTAWGRIEWREVAHAFVPENHRLDEHGDPVWGDEEDEDD